MRSIVKIVLLGLMCWHPAMAAEANRCSVTITPVQFGNYNSLQHGEVRTTGTLIYNCTMSRPISISLDRGAGYYENRRMTQGASSLNYNLYLDAAGTMIWGDGTGGSQVYRDAAPPPDTNVTVPIYGRIPILQEQPRIGFHDDMLLVTITY